MKKDEVEIQKLKDALKKDKEMASKAKTRQEKLKLLADEEVSLL